MAAQPMVAMRTLTSPQEAMVARRRPTASTLTRSMNQRTDISAAATTLTSVRAAIMNQVAHLILATSLISPHTRESPMVTVRDHTVDMSAPSPTTESKPTAPTDMAAVAATVDPEAMNAHPTADAHTTENGD